ncbi:MAG: autotransporter-associated beta strand repeat-containing protein [Verrucomicrobia bacterium]|nr:autotransporter-associated beta strand repeat-containing protein [Verrucomicrobiota bacterium]
MKNTLPTTRKQYSGRSHAPLAQTKPALSMLVALAVGMGSASATNLYWDTNGTTAGAGDVPSGTWGTSNFWNTDSTGGGSGAFQTSTSATDNLAFVAGGSAVTSPFTVSLNGNQTANTQFFNYANTNSANIVTIGSTVGGQTITLSGTSTSYGSSAGAGTVGNFLIDVGSVSSSNLPYVTMNANLAVSGNQQIMVSRGSLTLNGVISGTANLWIWGGGTKIVTGANTYSGTTDVRGSLTLGGAAGSLGTGAVNLNDNSTVLTFAQTSDYTFANNITGVGASSGVTKTGTTTLTLTGTNTSSGGTVVRGGAIKVASINNNLGSGPIKLGSLSTDSGSLIYNGSGETTSKTFQISSSTSALQADGSGALIVSTGISGANSGVKNFTLQGSSTAANSIGAITNGSATTLNLVKAGTGKWVLTGTNTYNGTTTVSAGTLLIDGDSSAATGAVTVNSGASIGGDGTIGGSLALLSGSKFVFSLANTLTVNGASVTFGGFSVADLVGLSSATASGTYTLINGSATVNLTNVSNVGSSNAYDLGGGKSAYFQASGLNLVVIPEPSTIALLIGAGLFLVLRTRRHKRTS